MNTTLPSIDTLLQWSAPREVQTKYGPRILRKAIDGPTPEFWEVWRAFKPELKSAGIQVTKAMDSDRFEVLWWAKLSESVQAERAQNEEQSRAATTDFEPPKPEGLEYYPFQKVGIEFALRNPGTLIGDDMGLGKTVQAIGLMNCCPEIRRVLVVTKASLKDNWKREIQKWLVDPMTVGIANSQYWPRTQVVILNYDILGKFHNHLRAEPWDLVVLDESAQIKNRKTKRAIEVIGYKPTKKELADGVQPIPPIPGRRRLALSGTPIENRVEEFWSTLHYLDPERWGNFWGFAKRYCNMVKTDWGMQTSGASNLDQLQKVLRSTIMIRRLKSEVLPELPRKTRMIIDLDTEGLEQVIENERRRYAEHAKALEDAQARLELARADSDEAFKEAVKNMSCADLAFEEIARIRHDTAVAKLPKVIEMLEEELEETSGKILVFGHHRDVLDPLSKRFPASITITGAVDPAARQGLCDLFQTMDMYRIAFLSIRAAGEGLNLTAANLVIFVEEDWVPSKISQCEDRAHRIGQKDNVLVKHYVLPGTIDSRMLKTTMAKQEIIDKALDNVYEGYASEPTFAPHKTLGKRSEIQNEGLLMTSNEIQAVQIALKTMASMCDGARTMDGHGFNKVDAIIGRKLAQAITLTPAQAALGRRLCGKYRNQLGDEIMKAMGIKLKPSALDDEIPMD